MLELPANVLLATHPARSERRHHQPCRRPYERKLGDQTKDDPDKEPREERSCGRSQTLLYNGARTHLSLEKDAPVSRAVERAGQILCRPILGGLHHQYGRIYDRHNQLFRFENAQNRSLETSGQFAKARHWRAFLRVSRAFSPSVGLPGWRRSADRTRLQANSLLTGNFTG